MVQLNNIAPIAIIDSGVGGLSVLAELKKIMPEENYLYFGDTANAPYGTKSREQVLEIMLENTEKLISLGVKAIVVACNTATSAAVRVMREKYPDMPIVGIEPAIKPALLVKEHPTVVFVTHDIDEAVFLANKISKLNAVHKCIKANSLCVITVSND